MKSGRPAVLPVAILFAAAFNLVGAVFAGAVPPVGTIIYWALVSGYWLTRTK